MREQEATTIPPIVNRLMGGVLRSPVHAMASRSIMLITFSGRKSGKIFTTPVSYIRDGDLVTAFTHANWWRNLLNGAPVTVCIKNKEYQGVADVVSEDKAAVAEGLQAFLRRVRFDARFYQVEYDENGDPNWDEVQRAAQSTVMLRIRLNEAI